MRCKLLPLLLLPLTFSFSSNACASTIDESQADPQIIQQLQARALQANPREQCFLYTELVHAMTELAGHQMLAGEADQASNTLKQVEHYAQLIHLGLAHDTKRLKNAEMLMHHTTYRLSNYLHAASSDDKVVLQATLKQLDLIQNELLNQVFSH